MKRATQRKCPRGIRPIRNQAPAVKRQVEPALACYPLHMKVAEMLRMLQSDGWQLVATRVSHRQFRLNSIYKQASLTK